MTDIYLNKPSVTWCSQVSMPWYSLLRVPTRIGSYFPHREGNVSWIAHFDWKWHCVCCGLARSNFFNRDNSRQRFTNTALQPCFKWRILFGRRKEIPMDMLERLEESDKNRLQPQMIWGCNSAQIQVGATLRIGLFKLHNLKLPKFSFINQKYLLCISNTLFLFYSPSKKEQ